jgi:hypothetical protein
MARRSLTYIPRFSVKFFFQPIYTESGSPDTILEGAIQESFQQSLVEIGSVVSEEKIFF